MYCGNCLRDNALVSSLRHLGHQALMVPMYLPLTLDEPDQSANLPVFFGGISVFLEQEFPSFRRAPAWLHSLLAARPLLRLVAGGAAKTQPRQAGELALSMLEGEEGKQARELDALIEWLKTQPKPDVICLSNALLLGSARRLQSELGATVVCMLQGEDSFLDGLPEPYRNACWKALAQRAAAIQLFVSPSRYFGELMLKRLGLSTERLRVVFNGINLEGYAVAANAPPRGDAQASTSSPVLGFFARMCREKGLDTLVDAFILLCRRARVPGLQLRVGGSCGPSDELLVRELRRRLAAASLLDRVEFRPNLSREQKLEFFKGLSVFSVPASYGEAFGLYLLEALAAGVPVVQPATAAFPEVLAATEGGLLCEPGNVDSLANTIESLLLDPEQARRMGARGREAVFKNFSSDAMAKRMLQAWAQAVEPARPGVPANSGTVS
jgi:glycosyltransferase involved in cell wall biosynthesis